MYVRRSLRSGVLKRINILNIFEMQRLGIWKKQFPHGNLRWGHTFSICSSQEFKKHINIFDVKNWIIHREKQVWYFSHWHNACPQYLLISAKQGHHALPNP
uniref:Uncharacterized protein n=1 Tax=Micrurus carvalhoi TaxID=3147026 RepID=A0A2H6MUG4_9SAUR